MLLEALGRLGDDVVSAPAAGADDLRSGLDPEVVADMVFGALWYRILLTERPPDHALADELVELIAQRPQPRELSPDPCPWGQVRRGPSTPRSPAGRHRGIRRHTPHDASDT